MANKNKINELYNDILKARDHLMPGATESDVYMFAQVCHRSGLDPFTRQIYAISRNIKDHRGNWTKKFTFQLSIDGLRSIAERSGNYEGQTPVYWCGLDGNWVDVWLSDQSPAACKVGVFKKGHKEPNWAVAKFSSYCQTNKDGKPISMWAKMPEIMIAKCCESLALRKAFPNELSGLYTNEEMGQADKPAPESSYIGKQDNGQPENITSESEVTAEMIDEFRQLQKRSKTPDSAVKSLLSRHHCESVRDLPLNIYEKTILRFKDLIENQQAEKLHGE